jgi:hypothetical protein
LTQEQESQDSHRVRQLELVVAVGIGRIKASRRRLAKEQESKNPYRIRQLELAVVVRIAAVE